MPKRVLLEAKRVLFGVDLSGVVKGPFGTKRPLHTQVFNRHQRGICIKRAQLAWGGQKHVVPPLACLGGPAREPPATAYIMDGNDPLIAHSTPDSASMGSMNLPRSEPQEPQSHSGSCSGSGSE